MNRLFEAVEQHPEEESPLAEQDLREVEKSLGVSLPSDYREFLHDYGWSTVHRSFPMSNGERGHVDDFMGINWGKSDLVGAYKMRLDERPPDFIEIASSDAGTIFLSLNDKNKGTIYFWDNWEQRKEKFEDNLIFVASSFDEFMKLLDV